MTPRYTGLPGGARLSFGAEEFVFVELVEAMDLAISLRVQSIVAAIAGLRITGIVDIVPAHVSYLIRLDPDRLDPRDLIPVLADLHADLLDSGPAPILTRIVEIPVMYDDPWTQEVAARFRDRHPSPGESDLAFTARTNGFESTEALIAAHAAHPFIVTFNNFMPGNAECVQLVPEQMQIQVPKYLTPRTDTPARALGHGGNQATIYPVQAPGGFQLLGRAAVPVLDFTVKGPGFTDTPALLPAPTVVKYAPVDLSGYEAVEQAVLDGSYILNEANIEFVLEAFDADPLGYARSLVGELR